MKVLAPSLNQQSQKPSAVGSALDSFLAESQIYQDVIRKAQLEFLEIVNPSISNNAGYQKTVKLYDSYLATKKREKALMQILRSCSRKRVSLHKEYLYELDQLKKHPDWTSEREKMYTKLVDNLRKTTEVLK